MRRSRLVRALARRFPLPLRVLCTLSLKGYLPLAVYEHWLVQLVAADLWADESRWIGRTARLRNGMRIEVDARDLVGHALVRRGRFEPETVRFVEAYLTAGMTCLDVGAHVGQYALLASGRVGPAGAVHAFEPHPLLHAVLCRNVRRNRCANVTAHRLALGRDEGMEPLFLSRHRNLGQASLAPPGPAYAGVQTPVTVVPLDAWAERVALRRLDLVKIDVEGAELRVLEGATGTLSAWPDAVLVIEFCASTARRFGSSAEDLASWLRDRGFRLFSLTARGPEPYAPLADDDAYVNVVATRGEIPAVTGRTG